jgi:4-diphosphocytidyl-2-C-methyl-D-erythritol kinase
MGDHTPYPDTIELSGGSFAMLSPAKINLRLKVLGRRPDGYHELDTLFQEITLADRIEFHPSFEWRLEIHGAHLDAGDSNLITRAAKLLAAEAEVPCKGRLVVHKHIPVQGGLGGGSSNAAIALLGLSRLWQLNWPLTSLHRLASSLGSDCAYFLYGGLVQGQGRGEVLEPLADRVEKEVLLVAPPFGVSTSEAFSWGAFALTDDEKSVILNFRKKKFIPSLSDFREFSNDLENIVLDRYEELGRIKRMLLEAEAEVAMLSGSGSCIFALYSDRARAMRAAQQFREPYRIHICQTVSRPRPSR